MTAPAAPAGAASRSPCKLASVLLQYPTSALFDGIGALEEAAAARGEVAAVGAHLPRLGRRELDLVRRAWEAGPPAEEVGLEPFAPPDYLTAPTGTGHRADLGIPAGPEGRP